MDLAAGPVPAAEGRSGARREYERLPGTPPSFREAGHDAVPPPPILYRCSAPSRCDPTSHLRCSGALSLNRACARAGRAPRGNECQRRQINRSAGTTESPVQTRVRIPADERDLRSAACQALSSRPPGRWGWPGPPAVPGTRRRPGIRTLNRLAGRDPHPQPTPTGMSNLRGTALPVRPGLVYRILRTLGGTTRSLVAPATLRRGHVHDQTPVGGLKLQKRSDERTVAASHVRDVAPENGSTTSRRAERNDVVDAQISLQSIGDPGGMMVAGLVRLSWARRWARCRVPGRVARRRCRR